MHWSRLIVSMMLVLASVLWMDRVLADVSGASSDEIRVALIDAEGEAVSDTAERDGDDPVFMIRLPKAEVAIAAAWPGPAPFRETSQSPPPPSRPPSA